MCNYVAFFPQKYGTFKNKMPCLKFTKFYYSHILVEKKTLIWLEYALHIWFQLRSFDFICKLHKNFLQAITMKLIGN
jgi:hypothetical protein